MFKESPNNLKYLEVSLNAFQNFGIDVLNTKDGKLIKQPIKLMFVFLSSFFCAILMFIYAVIHFGDMIEVSRALGFLIPWCLATVKTLIFIWKGKDFIQLIEYFQILKQKVNEKENKILLKENKRAFLVTRVYFLTCRVGVVVLLALPAFLMLFTYARTGQFILEPPYRGMYMFHDYYHLYYALSYITFFYFLRTMVAGALHVDSLLFWCIKNICGHFIILQEKFKSAAGELGEEEPTLDFRPKFIAAILHHRYVIRLTDNLNRAYALIVLAEVAFSCFQICMFIYQSRSGPEINQVPIIVLALLAMSIQLSIYCIGGQQIQNLSDMTAEKIYICFPWERIRPQEKHLLLLPLMRSQRTITLAAHFFVTNNNLLLVVFRAAFSISAVFAVMNK